MSAPLSPPPIEMLSPTGERRTVQERHAGTLRALGYRDITPELDEELADKAKYGGTLGEVAAAGLGFARGASLGLSDLAARGAENAGILPEGTTDDIRKLKELNPSASLAGELASFVTPGLGAIKALGTAGKTAKALGAAQTAVGKVGEALGKSAAKVAGKELGQFAAPAVRTAAESAVFQAGMNLSENVLANRELTAEAVLANTGEAAILGAGLGMGIPLALRGAKKAATAALESEPVQWASGYAGKEFAKLLDPQRAAQLASGAKSKGSLLENTPEARAFQKGVKGIWDAGGYKNGIVEVDQATGLLTQVEGARLPPTQRELIGRWRSILDAEEKVKLAVLAEAQGKAARSAGWTSADSDAVLAKIKQWRAGRNIGSDAIAEGLAARVEDAAQAAEAAAGDIKALHDIRKGLDDQITEMGGFFKLQNKKPIEVMADLRTRISEKIRSGVGELEGSGAVSQGSLDRWNNANKMQADILAVKKALEKQAGKTEANVNVFGLNMRSLALGSLVGGVAGGPAGVAAGAAIKLFQSDQALLARAAVGERLAALGWLQKSTAAAQGNIAKTVAGFLRGVDEVAIGSAATRSPRAIGGGVTAAGLAPEVRQATDQQWFAETSQELARVTADPETFAEEQYQRLGALATYAPSTADTIITKQLQIYDYLSQVMPKNPGRPVSLLAPTWRPSDYEIQEFRDVVRTARKPLSILQELQRGTATRAQTKALQTLYPALYEQMLGQVREQVSKPGASLSYDRELKLGMLFPGAVPSMSGAFINSMSNGAPAEEPPNTRSGYRAGGAGKMKVGSRTSTKVDALSER